MWQTGRASLHMAVIGGAGCMREVLGWAHAEHSICCASPHMSSGYAGKGLFAPKAPFWEKPTFLLYTAAQVCSWVA